jgi:hypothetical protein
VHVALLKQSAESSTFDCLPDVVFHTVLPTHHYQGKPDTPPTVQDMLAQPQAPGQANAALEGQRVLERTGRPLYTLELTIGNSMELLGLWLRTLKNKPASVREVELLEKKVVQGKKDVLQAMLEMTLTQTDLQTYREHGGLFAGHNSYGICYTNGLQCPDLTAA